MHAVDDRARRAKPTLEIVGGGRTKLKADPYQLAANGRKVRVSMVQALCSEQTVWSGPIGIRLSG